MAFNSYLDVLIVMWIFLVLPGWRFQGTNYSRGKVLHLLRVYVWTFLLQLGSLRFNYSKLGWGFGCKLFPEEIARIGPVFEGKCVIIEYDAFLKFTSSDTKQHFYCRVFFRIPQLISVSWKKFIQRSIWRCQTQFYLQTSMMGLRG